MKEEEHTNGKRSFLLLGCTAATCTMCSIPNEAYYNLNLNFTPEDFLRQFHFSFETEPIDSYQLISVYNNGNWFANNTRKRKRKMGDFAPLTSFSCRKL